MAKALVKVDCGKCGGKGHIRAFTHVVAGICFACDGNGFKMLKAAPKPARKFKVSFLWTDPKNPNYNDGDFCHCWNESARSLPAVQRKAAAAQKRNGSVDFKIEEV